MLTISLQGYAAMDPYQTMKESDQRLRANDQYGEYKMELYDHDKLVTTRLLTRMDKKGINNNLTLLRFTSPATIKGVGALIENSVEASNNIWTYTPSTKTLRRIFDSQKQNWFMGTDFTYEDFEDYKLNAYRFEFSGKEVSANEAGHLIVVDSYPVKSIDVEASAYSKKRYFLETESLYPVAIEYYDKNNRLVKKLVSEGLKSISGFIRPDEQVMYNYIQNTKTRIVTMKISINKGVSDVYFTPRYLRNEDK